MSSSCVRQVSSTIFSIALSMFAGPVLAAGSWIINGGFDTSLGGWTILYGRPAAWNAGDGRGVPDSGSVRITNQGVSNGGAPITLGQCVPLSPATGYTFGARVKVPAGQPTNTTPMVFVDTYNSTDCTAPISNTHSFGSPAASWEVQSGNFTSGASTHSAYVSLAVWKPTGQSADAAAFFDTVYLRETGLPFAAGPSMSASWFNPAQSGHGIMLEYLTSSSAWMCWFTFDLSGNRSWICGMGNVSGNTISFPDAYLVNGGKFPPLFNPAAISGSTWGSINIVFSACDTGTMSWTTSIAGYQSGSMPLSRLTNEWANGCSQ